MGDGSSRPAGAPSLRPGGDPLPTTNATSSVLPGRRADRGWTTGGQP